MKTFSALVSITDQRFGSTYLYFTIGGQPQAMAATINTALQGARTVLNARRLAMLLIEAVGHRRLLSAAMYFETEIDFVCAHSPDYRYDIELPSLRPRQITVTEISDANVETQYYPRGAGSAPLDSFITDQNRRMKKPRGRTPNGYTRDEWVEVKNMPKKDTRALPPTSDRLAADIERDRLNSPPAIAPDLTGVREYTREERIARRKARKTAEKK